MQNWRQNTCQHTRSERLTREIKIKSGNINFCSTNTAVQVCNYTIKDVFIMQSRLFVFFFFYIAELCTSPCHRYLTTFWCKADSRGNEGRYLKQKYTKKQLQIDCCTLMSGGHGKWVGGLSWDRTSSLILFRRGAPCRGLFVFSLLSSFPILPRPINLPPFLQPFSVLSSSSKLCVGSVSSLL